ncbi:MAG: hypothetical protein HY689_16395 [Chloroflexi bacterium]|nr:hypothetical protein [Chloroflexota bacterium]
MTSHDALNYIEIQNETGRPIVVQVQQSRDTFHLRIVIDDLRGAPDGPPGSPSHGTSVPPRRVTFAPVSRGLS